MVELYGINTPVATTATIRVQTDVPQAIARLLDFIDCRNINLYAPPPLTTWDSWRAFLNVYSNLPQPKNEAWYTDYIRTGTRTDFNRATRLQYHQIDEVVITGLVWHVNFRQSYVYIQDKSEELMYTLEKNKSLLQSEQLETFTTMRCDFSWRQFGEVYLYRSDIALSLLSTLTETE